MDIYTSATITNVALILAVVVLVIATGSGWWSLLLLFIQSVKES